MSEVFPNFFKMIKNQFGVCIKRLRSDNARDYFNQTLSTFLQKEGGVHHSSCVDTPQQNGVIEWKNKHLLEVTQALLFQTHVPKSYRGEAVLTAAYLINRTPMSSTIQESYECFFQPFSRFSHHLQAYS